MLLPPPYSHQHHYLKPCFNNSLFDPSSSLSSPKSTAFTTSNSKPFLRCSSLMFNPSHNETTNFSLSSPPVSVMSSIPSSQPLIPSQLPNTTSTFQFNPLSCSLNPADNLQSQPDSDQYFSCISIHSTKPELPSSQFYLCQIEKSGEKPVLGRSNSMLLLDDLLEDAQAAASSENPQSPTLMNLQEEKLDVSVKAGCSWDATSSVITPAGNLNHHHSDINGHEDFHLPPVQDVAGADNETTQEMQRLQKDLLKILNVVPGFLKRVKDEAGLKKKTKTSDDCMQDDVPKLLNAGGDTPAVTNESKGEYLNGQLSAYASAGGGDTMKGFEMEQQVASFFSIETPDFGQTLDSCSWDNLPGIC